MNIKTSHMLFWMWVAITFDRASFFYGWFGDSINENAVASGAVTAFILLMWICGSRLWRSLNPPSKFAAF